MGVNRLMHIHKLCMVEVRKTTDDHEKDGIGEYAWDDVTGEELEVDRVRGARKKEMHYSTRRRSGNAYLELRRFDVGGTE